MLKIGPVAAIGVVLAFPSAAFPQHVEKPGTQVTADAAPRRPDYSQEPFVIEQYYTRSRFEKDGTGRRELHVRIRVQSEAGVQQLGQLVFGYNSANERMTIDSVEVHKADGSAATAAADAVQDMTSPVARDAPVYTDYRQKHVTVPGLRPGETLAYHITTQVHTALALGQFWLEHDFLKDAIVLDERLEVSVPRDRAIKLKTQPPAQPMVTEEGDLRIYRWKTSNLQREDEESDEAKPRKKPRKKLEVPAVQLTTFQSWEEVGRWYAGLEHERATPNAAVRAKAQELVHGRETDLEKIEALYDFVAKNFRYVSLSFGLGRYQPHTASEVLANQYGDCKDKHTLLEALAEAVGLHAYPVLINSARKIDPEMPSPAQFDHVITAVPSGKDGKELIWLDSTTEVAPFRLLAARLRKKQALWIPTAWGKVSMGSEDSTTPSEKEGAAHLVETPSDPPFPATQRVEVEGRVGELGKLTAQVRYTLRGDAELLLRLAFRRTPQNQWKQLAQLLAASDGFRGEASEVKAADPAATREPFQLEYRIVQPNYLDWSSKKSQLLLPLPAVGLPDAPETQEEDDSNSEPLELGTPLDLSTRLTLELPPKFAARAPVAVAVMRDYAEYRSAYKAEGNKITAERRLRFKLREVPAVRIRDYLAFARAVRSDEGQSMSLENTLAGTPAVPTGVKADELHEAGLAALQNGNFSTAADLLKRVIELEPKHKWAWNNLGRAYLAQRRLDEAIQAFRKQIEVNPYDEYAYNNLGQALWQQQKHEEAIEAFRKQIEIKPLDRWAHANLGTLYRERRNYVEAIRELEQAISITPDDPLLHVGIGDAYLNLGKGDKALQEFDKAVELAPSPTVWNNVAYQLSLKNAHLERAQQYAESAVAETAAQLRNAALERLGPQDLGHVTSLAAYWDTLGWVHFQKGNLKAAEKYIHASWLLNQHGEVGDHLAQIYEKLGRKQEAIQTYAQALAATRPPPETRERLARLAGGEDELKMLRTRGGEELSALRTVKLGKLLKESASAEFFVLFSPGLAAAPAAGAAPASGTGAKIEEVRFASGSEKLRPLAEALRAIHFSSIFPDDTPTKLVRRGILSCSALTGECVFVLLPPDLVTSVN